MSYLFPELTPYYIPDNPFRGQITDRIVDAHKALLAEALGGGGWVDDACCAVSGHAAEP
jgi:hypothetical protein